MIPDFKTYLKESVWMDIHKRSTGVVDRKEEDINLLDINSFHKYLLNRYEKTNDYFHDGYINIFPQSHIINIMLFENTEESRVYRVIIWNFNRKPYITIPRKPLFTQSDFFKKIEEKYTLVKSGDDLSPLFTVKSKDGSDDSSNKFFVEVIDFLLDNIEPPFDPYLKRVDDVNESVWMDIHKHSTGDVERKEDRLVGAVKNLVPVDLGGKCLWADQDLEIDGQTAFTYDDASQFIDGVNGWRLPTFTDIMNLDTRIMFNDYSFQDDELHITNRKTNGELVFSNQGPYPGLKGFYYFWHVDGGIRYGKASYFTKDKNNKCVVGSFGSSDPRYTFCIRLVKDKEVSESVWMDIHKHSTGDAERKEESIDLLDGDEFWEYLKDHYISYNSRHIIQGPFLENIISMPFMDEAHMLECDLEIEYEPGRTKIKCISIPLCSVENYPDIEDVFELGDGNSDRKVGLYPKDGGELKNSFAITVIDYIFDVDRRHKRKYAPWFHKKNELDESVWMDIHKRSNMDTDRKEELAMNKWTRKELLEYLRGVYKFKHACDFEPDPRFDSSFSIPIISKNGTRYSLNYNMYLNIPKYDQMIFLNDRFTRAFPDIMDWLNQNYTVNTIGYFDVSPKDGSKVTVLFFIEFLSDFVDYLENSHYDNIISKR